MPLVKKFFDHMVARFPPDTFARIAAVLGPTEDRADFVRLSVERELRRREQQAPAAKPSPARRKRAAA